MKTVVIKTIEICTISVKALRYALHYHKIIWVF